MPQNPNPVSVLNSILSLTPTLTPLPTSTSTPTPTLTPEPTLTPTPTLIPSIITLYTGSTIVSQSGTQITINDATAFSSRTDDGLTVDILWGDGTSMKNISVKDKLKPRKVIGLNPWRTSQVYYLKHINLTFKTKKNFLGASFEDGLETQKILKNVFISSKEKKFKKI